MKKIAVLILTTISLSAKAQKPDTVQVRLLISNCKKKIAPAYTIAGYKVTTPGSTIYLGRNKKPIPPYIKVWMEK